MNATDVRAMRPVAPSEDAGAGGMLNALLMEVATQLGVMRIKCTMMRTVAIALRTADQINVLMWPRP
jgi:hypothetical protein